MGVMASVQKPSWYQSPAARPSSVGCVPYERRYVKRLLLAATNREMSDLQSSGPSMTDIVKGENNVVRLEFGG